jgi:small nuclear ribonucleoprotein (snRNP)-like protein
LLPVAVSIPNRLVTAAKGKRIVVVNTEGSAFEGALEEYDEVSIF